jgi:hypothetical protein
VPSIASTHASRSSRSSFGRNQPSKPRARSVPQTCGPSDALHLAAAAELGDDIDGTITYDKRLAAACESAGIEVVAPGLGARRWDD